MKTLMLLIALTTWTFIAFSQPLSPQIQLQNNDTVFCFTMPQSRMLAKQLEQSLYCDSILKQTELEVELLQQVGAVKDSALLVLNLKTGHQQGIIGIQDTMIKDLNTQIKMATKKIRRQKWVTVIVAAGMFLSGILVLETSH